jgi:hypothetical protein
MNIKAMLSGASDAFLEAGFSLKRLDRMMGELGVPGERVAADIADIQRNLRIGTATLRTKQDAALIASLRADITNLGDLAAGVSNLKVVGRGTRAEFGPTIGETLIHIAEAGRASDLRQGIGVPKPVPKLGDFPPLPPS